MARETVRASGPTEPSSSARSGAATLLAGVAALAGCATYEAAPVEPAAVLAELERARYEPPPASAGGASPAQLAAFAVAHNPAFAAARARLGVARALLVEAGRLADPELGWDGMDALASQLVQGATERVDFVSGIGLSIPLPRPGELDAEEDAARWRVEEARRELVRAEWELARDVHLACEDVRAAAQRLELDERLAAVARRTREHFERARESGAATAVEASLAAGDELAIRAARLHDEARLRAARRRLAGLLGLPPAAEVPLAAPAAEVEAADEPGPEQLVERALARRPDLAALLAAYGAAEAELRLAVARQVPQLAVGTGLSVVPGLFRGFGRHAVATATARRGALARELTSRVHELRAEVHDAHAALEEARVELAFLQDALLPNTERTLELAGLAFDEGEATLLEILTVQRALVDARTRAAEARAEVRRRRWRLLAASGALLARAGETEIAAVEEHER